MKNMNDSIIRFTADDGSVIEFEVVEQAKLGGNNYLLVTEAGNEEDEADACILKEIEDVNGESVFEFVEDDSEFDAVSALFNSLLEDIDLVEEEE